MVLLFCWLHLMIGYGGNGGNGKHDFGRFLSVKKPLCIATTNSLPVCVD